MAMLPAFDRPRVSVLRCDARDRVAFMTARYAITDWADAWQYQPLLYVDTDTIFDADIAPALHAIACSDRISAPHEAHSPLRTWAPVGAGLLQLDGCDPRSMVGFNSGTIGIPNLAGHAHTLRLIGRLITNNAALNGRDSLPYADQEIANYVSFKIGHFDTVLLSRYVRAGGGVLGPARQPPRHSAFLDGRRVQQARQRDGGLFARAGGFRVTLEGRSGPANGDPRIGHEAAGQSAIAAQPQKVEAETARMLLPCRDAQEAY